MVVTDEYQGKGLGTELVDMLISIAQEKGLESIYGTISPENRKMVRLCEKLGFTFKPTETGMIATLSLV